MAQVNYDDKRLTAVKAEEKTALSDLEKTYNGMIDKSDKYYDDQIEASKDWAEKQAQIQQQQTDFTIEKIEQQKEQSQKDYTKEQSGAYVDWKKQSNEYGANAENMAAQGLQNTGFSESSQVSMYNTYQNRVATAIEVFAQVTLNYDNGIKEAKLQNSAALAEIHAQAYQKQLELAAQAFQHKNSLLLELTNKKLEVKQMYNSQWQNVLDQINKENSLAEQIRQYNASLELEKEKFAYQKEQDALNAAKIDKGGSGSNTTTAQKRASQTKARAAIREGLSGKSSDLTVVNSPLTAEGAAQKVASGELIVTKQEGNRIWVASNPNYTKGQSTLDKYTSLAKLFRTK